MSSLNLIEWIHTDCRCNDSFFYNGDDGLDLGENDYLEEDDFEDRVTY